MAYTDSKGHLTRFSKITLTRASRKTPCDIVVEKKKKKKEQMSMATNYMVFWSKVFIISEMTTKRCDSEGDMVCCWCGYSASWGLKMNHRKASGDWVTNYKNIRGNHFYVNKCKMTHENTILTLQTNLIMAPTWLLLLKRFYSYNTWLHKNINTNIRYHCWIKIF